MKVLYDHQIFTIQQRGGISRYFSELIKVLHDTQNVEIQTSIKFTNNKHLAECNGFEKKGIFPRKYFRGKSQIQSFLNRYSSQRIIRKGKFDLFHPTYYNPYYLSDISNKPMVVTVYDMIHERLSGYFPEATIVTESKKKVVERADKVIAISQSTKNDLIELFGTQEEKVDVVHLGSSFEYYEQRVDVDLEWLPETFILFVGNRGAYKNFQKFMEAVVPIFKDDEDLCLVCVGGGNFRESEKEFFSEHDIEDRALQLSCSDKELAHIYKNARCFVFPSLYEGFGLPILEAFSANCPVACSNCTSLPEVAGDAAVYFDPKSEHDIREAVRKVIYDDDLREDFIRRGAKRSEKFSWKETARQTKEIYESLI